MWHISNFDPREVIEFAMGIEKNGTEFYQKLAQKAEQEKVKELLLFLATEEEKHLQDFKELGEDFEAFKPRETYDGEYLDYINSTVETHLFKDLDQLEQLLGGVKSEADIIKLATSLEKDSIIFFQSLRSLVNEKKQNVIDNLIKEEQQHLIKLLKIKENLNT